MDCSLSLKISIKKMPESDKHARYTLWALALTLASTVIIFGSLGAIQNQCRNEDPYLLVGVRGFSAPALSCKKIYRYYWFITALSAVTAIYGLWITARGFLTMGRGAVLGLLVMANLLVINMTDAFLTMQNIPKWQGGVGRDRVNTMIAGCIITAVFQSLAIILVGFDSTAPADEKPVRAAKAVEEPATVELAPAVAAPAASPAAETTPAVDPEAPAPPADAPAMAAPAEEVAAPVEEVAAPVEEGSPRQDPAVTVAIEP